jgi:hypothetical protein
MRWAGDSHASNRASAADSAICPRGQQQDKSASRTALHKRTHGIAAAVAAAVGGHALRSANVCSGLVKKGSHTQRIAVRGVGPM